METSSLLREERDLLIELRTELRGIREDMKMHMDGTNERLKVLEHGKIDRTEVNRLQAESLSIHTDHEARLRVVERRGWFQAGGAAAVGAITSALVHFLHI